ncbi:sugar 3,4-ketoisomerase [Psychroflexus sediminis]|uniref:WxcM-like, C-terminal n=1 Tax=Psychroflexus sediminis TaxID=470826 RepID=A0A1G7ZDS5_9FLAO|nr:FdtA/QdtA family cupin domain-containing protein [Psychroflexus sediminis]SDH06696.1 WxcM-like, C-terminal [Psychroflexus sediminis]
MTKIEHVKVIDLPKITDKRGDLTFLQKNVGLPFELQRIFWTYDLKTHSKRGGHAYKAQNEVICVVSGSADLIVTNKDNAKEKITLNRADKGVFIPPNVWRHLENFATNTILLHISDSEYDEDDYIRDINKYLL